MINIENNKNKNYHSQIHDEVEQYNRSIIVAIRTYVTEHLHDWNCYKKALNFAYDCYSKT